MELLNLPQNLEEYQLLEEKLRELDEQEWAHTVRVLAQRDLFFLLRYVLSTREWERNGKPFFENEWLLQRCREVQFDNNNVLNIWARGHAKSTISTFGNTIRQILADPNETIAIFSVTKTVAESFLFQVKVELERNEKLKALFPDILYEEPWKQSDKWTISNGIICKRSTNSREATVEAWGLIDSNFTGRRFSIQKYDDAVNESNVTTPDMIDKTNRAWELSLATARDERSRREYIGTFYSYGDTYHHMAKRGLRVRLHPCYEIDFERSKFQAETGLPQELVLDDSKPVFKDGDWLKSEELTMGTANFGVQMRCDPNAGEDRSFDRKWLRFYDKYPGEERRGKNVYILVDPANEKKKDSSYTSIWVVGVGMDGNYYVLDGVRDKLDLGQRISLVMELHRKWKPIEVRYEQYGLFIDTSYLRMRQEAESYRFPVVEVKGKAHKDDRIARLVPLFSAGKVFLPKSLLYNSQYDNEIIDLVEVFIEEEYAQWPNSKYKDMLDSLSRIAEPEHPVFWPQEEDYWDEAFGGDRLKRAIRKSIKASKKTNTGWMGS